MTTLRNSSGSLTGAVAGVNAVNVVVEDASNNYTGANVEAVLAEISDDHIEDATLHFTEGSIDHTAITNIGTNTHAQIDTHITAGAAHIADTANPHSVTAAQIDAGLDDIAGLAVTDGNIIVGDGANWVAESGNTARTSLGLGTGNSPEFTNVTVGGTPVATTGINTFTESQTISKDTTTQLSLHKDSNATGTGPALLFKHDDSVGSIVTTARIFSIMNDATTGSVDSTMRFDVDTAGTVAMGMSLTGTTLSVVGGLKTAGNDVISEGSAEISGITEKVAPVSADLLMIEDSAASNAKKRVQIGNLPGGSTAATQADQETGTSLITHVTPGRQQFHQSATKFFVKFNGTGTVAIKASYNVTSITDNGTGSYDTNIDTDFSSADWCVGGLSTGGGFDRSMRWSTMAAGSVRTHHDDGTAAEDPADVCVFGFGDQ